MTKVVEGLAIGRCTGRRWRSIFLETALWGIYPCVPLAAQAVSGCMPMMGPLGGAQMAQPVQNVYLYMNNYNLGQLLNLGQAQCPKLYALT